MKALKIVGFILGGLIVLIAVLLALALTPAVQTWAVRKAVAGQPGMTLEVDRVAAGPSAADIANLRYAKDGIIVTAKGVSAKYSAWDYVTKRRINADQVTVEELFVDLRNAKPAATATNAPAGPSSKQPGATGATGTAKPQATAEKKAPFEGLLKQAQLPFDVRVANLVAKGRALLPDDQSVTFELSGANIETGQRGKLEWTIDFADAKKDAALRGLRTTGNAGLHISGDRRIDLVEIDATAAAIGPKLPADRVKLLAKADQPSPGGNEGYLASVALVRGNETETIFKTSAQFIAASREITGAWELSVRTEQLAAVLAGLGLPEVAANGSGKFNLKPDTNTVAASGDLQGQASQLAKLSPTLEAIGDVHFKTTFDGGLADNIARLEKLDVEITGLDGKKFAQISSLQKVTYSLADKRVTLANPNAELARIAVQELPLAWAQPVVKPMTIESGDLSLTLAVEAEPDGSRIRVRPLEPLALRTVTVRDAAKKPLVEKLTVTTRPSVDYSATKIVAQLAELNVSMPTGDALTGNVSADVTNLATKTPAIAFSTQLQGKVVSLLKPYLQFDPGPLSISVTVEGRQEGDIVDVAKATSVVNRENGALLSSSELLQPVRANLKTSTLTVQNPNATAVRLRMGEIPLAWAEGYVPNSKFAGSLSGATLEVALRSLDDLTINTPQPVALRGVSATLDGKPMVQGLDLLADLTATKRGQNVAYEVRRVDVKQGDTALASLNVTGEAKLGAKLTLAAKGKLDADAAALMKQPVAAPFATLSRGRVAATFDATMTDAIQAKASVSAKNLVAKQENRALGDIELTLNADMKPDGSGTVSAPLTLTNAGRKSDVTINGTFGKAANKQTFIFAGRVAANQIVIDDFQPLAALAPSSEAAKPTVASTPSPSTRQPAPTQTPSQRPGAPAPTTGSRPPVATTPAPSGRDTEPFWKGANGKVEVDIKRLLYGKDYVINGVRGTAVITDTKLSLDGLEGRFKENPFKIAGGLTFAAQQPKPYSLNASADVQNLDIGEILQAANPNEKPALETKATLTARLNGSGGNVLDLGKNAFGKFELTGSQGVMRYLARKGQAGAAVNIASFGLAVLGAARGSDTTVAIAELARALNEVNFDSVKVQIERAADLSFKLTSLEFISPVLRLTGSGSVASKQLEDVQNAPMDITLELGAKGELGYLLQRVNMLSANKDPKGYQLMSRNFTIGGTPAKPDSSSLWKILGEAAIGGLLR